MKKTALIKNTLREFLQSKTRFFSILGIIMLGVGFYAGIKSTGPDMLATGDRYFSDQKLMDLHIQGTMGIDNEELDALTDIPEIKTATPLYTKDILKKEEVVRFYSYDSKTASQVNKYKVSKGRLPEQENEIALDAAAFSDGNLKIGDTYKIDSSQEGLTRHSYKIVGEVNQPMFIEHMARGNSTVGKGSVDYFAVVSKNVFDSPVYTDVFLTLKNTDDISAFSKKYDTRVKAQQKEVKKQLKVAGKKRVETEKKDSNIKLTDAKNKLAQEEQTLKQEQQKLLEQEQALPDTALLSMLPPDQQIEINAAQNAIAQGKEQIQQGTDKINQGKEQIKTQEEQLDKLKAPKYYVQTRSDNPGYEEYSENADRISAIATIFPVFFFLIAALVSLTTMTRMVEERRGEIGTFKALGYRNGEIAQKYIIYATAASLIGWIIGFIAGCQVFPKVIFNAYGTLYNLPDILIHYYPQYLIESLAVALACTSLTALVVLRNSLFHAPAELLRPKAPKIGKRILLERIPWLWNRLSFIYKVTLRNLFRYKQRMLMTVFGIAGCMALIMTGFGLKDSISDIVNIQFDKLWHYQAIVTYDENHNKQTKKAYMDTLEKSSIYEGHLPIATETVKLPQKGKTDQEATIYVPKSNQDLNKFITFNNRKTDKKYHLNDDGIIITEKLARLYNLDVGQEVKIKTTTHQEYSVKIQAITENYAFHYIYMTPNYYQKVFKQAPVYNTDLLKLKNKEDNKLAKELIDSKQAVNVTFVKTINDSMSDTMDSLNIVVWVLIISAGLLAFIVLYNLTNINISERIRELSTIKVLGFYDNEVTAYIYRENFILTLLGIIVGSGLGKILHRFVLQTAEVDMIMFAPDLHLSSYLYAALLTVFFTVVVMIIMHRKLTKVDMIEALKSGE